jgi:hypothetical protein
MYLSYKRNIKDIKSHFMFLSEGKNLKTTQYGVSYSQCNLVGA